MTYKGRSNRNSQSLILHICQREAWNICQKGQEAEAHGTYHAPSLVSEGFIHCSREDQILEVANTFYRDIPDLVLLWIDPHKVNAEIRWERVGEDEFPHIYGALNLDAVVFVSDLILDEKGYYFSVETQPPGNLSKNQSDV